MSTTSLMAELLVIGVTFLIGIGLIFAPLMSVSLEDPEGFFAQAKDFVSVGIFISIAIAYQIGWTLNGVAYYIFSRRTELAKLNDAFGWEYTNLPEAERQYREAHTRAFLESSKLADDLAAELSLIRLGRAGVLNLGLIGVGLALQWTTASIVGAVIALTLAYASMRLCSFRVDRLFHTVAIADKQVRAKKIAGDAP